MLCQWVNILLAEDETHIFSLFAVALLGIICDPIQPLLVHQRSVNARLVESSALSSSTHDTNDHRPGIYLTEKIDRGEKEIVKLFQPLNM